MPLLELPWITAITSTATFLMSLYLAWALHRHAHYDDNRVTLRQRLRHPTCPPEKLVEEQRERERSGG